MGQKRAFADVDDVGSGRPDGPKKGRPNGKTKSKGKEGSMSWTKMRARNIERLLQKDQDLPANVQNELERELAAHRASIADKAFQRKRSAMISKYHMVRFFERKKASRLVKQLRRKAADSEDAGEKETLQRKLHVAEVDEAYTLHFPHAEPYVSLYGSLKSVEKSAGQPEDGDDHGDGKNDVDGDDIPGTPVAQRALSRKRPDMWYTVEKAMESGGKGLHRLRERRSPLDADHAAIPTKSDRKAKTNGRKPQQNQDDPQLKSAVGAAKKEDARLAGLNRRERRKLMKKTKPPGSVVGLGAGAGAEEEDDGEGFFEEG